MGGGQAYIKDYGRKLGEGLIVHCYCNRAGYNALYRTTRGTYSVDSYVTIVMGYSAI